MKNFILYIWQLPQNLLGLLVVLFSRAWKRNDFYGVYLTQHDFGVSLGNYIILYEHCTHRDALHEIGHQKQSKRWGWLYLFVIGLPSVLRNLYDRWFHITWDSNKRIDWYYSSFPEKQADTLGGVIR